MSLKPHDLPTKAEPENSSTHGELPLFLKLQEDRAADRSALRTSRPLTSQEWGPRAAATPLTVRRSGREERRNTQNPGEKGPGLAGGGLGRQGGAGPCVVTL